MELPELSVFILGREPHPSITVDFIEALQKLGFDGSGIACKRHGIVRGFCDERALPSGTKKMECPFCARNRVLWASDSLVELAAKALKSKVEEFVAARVVDGQAEAISESEYRELAFAALDPTLEALHQMRIALENAKTEIESLRQAYGADAFVQLGETCDYEDENGNRCTNPPTRLVPHHAQVCDEHADTTQ